MRPHPEQEKFILDVKQNISELRTGKYPLFSTSKLAKIHGYTYDQAKGILKRNGLNSEIKSAIQERLSIPYPPSSELAWLMGYFSEHGSQTKNGIFVSDKIAERRKKVTHFVQTALNYTPVPSKNPTEKTKNLIFIANKEIRHRIGDVSHKGYANNLIDNYKWIPLDKKYVWAFLEGLIDSKAYVGSSRITINSKQENFIDYITSLFKSVGIVNLSRTYNSSGKYLSLSIIRSDDLSVISQNINLVKSQKDAEIKKFKPHRVHHWRISEPNGPFSSGVCIECGIHREFRNSLKYDPEFNEVKNREKFI